MIDYSISRIKDSSSQTSELTFEIHAAMVGLKISLTWLWGVFLLQVQMKVFVLVALLPALLHGEKTGTKVCIRTRCYEGCMTASGAVVKHIEGLDLSSPFETCEQQCNFPDLCPAPPSPPKDNFMALCLDETCHDNCFTTFKSLLGAPDAIRGCRYFCESPSHFCW